MAGEVEFRGLAAAEFDEEGDVDVGKSAGGTGVGESALVAILAPVDGDAASGGGGEEGLEEEEEE